MLGCSSDDGASSKPPGTARIELPVSALTVGEAGTFRCVAEDPDGDALTYVFDWGRAKADTGMSQRVPSGTAADVTATFQTAGEFFAARCRAVDTHGQVGAWSQYVGFAVQAPPSPNDGKRELTLDVMGLGKVRSTPSGIDGCTGTCSARFDLGTQVSLEVEPAEGWRFLGWLGCGADPVPNVLPLEFDRRCTARFAPKVEVASEWRQSGAVLPSDAEWGPGGTLLAVMDRSDIQGVVRVWNVSQGHLAQEIRMRSAALRSVAWGSQVRDLAVGLADGRVALFDPGMEAPYRTWSAHDGEVVKLDWSPGGSELATVHNIPTGGAEVRFWDAATGTESRPLLRTTRTVQQLHWSPDGQWLALEVQSGQVELHTLDLSAMPHVEEYAESFAWSPDGARYAVGRYQNVQVYATANHALEASWPGAWSVSSRLDWSPTKDWLVVSDLLRNLVVLDVTTGAVVTDASERPADPLDGTGYSALRFHPHGESFVAVEGIPAAVSLFTVEEQAPRAHRRELLTHTKAVNAVAWSPGGHTVASAGGDGKVRLWNASGQAQATLDGHDGKEVHSLGWNAEGTWLATGGADGRAILWDVASGVIGSGPFYLTPQAQGRTPRIDFVALQASGGVGYLAVAGHHPILTGRLSGVQVWNTRTGASLLHIPVTDSPVVALGWSALGLVIVHDDATWDVWNPETGTRQRVEGPWERLSAAALSPDGTQVACSDRLGVSVLDLATGNLVAEAASPLEQRTLAWSPDGKRFAGGGWTKLVFQWALGEDRDLPRSVVGAHEGAVTGVSWRPDGQALTSGGTDSALVTWRAP
ncbi:Protein kinase:G-protein beta WD-40 repeat protein [Myxococcus hansupus]|uniref:Protein kinase:G-protein beta WD-40 repeat protein n=2 Tax=Pseudomyxococcus hansupus TaxID=1297742 RepID=A0A0H4WY04_9BACT|nr:Protein kinase:G-protein beta WD-40 repeat protein [Myxococcus hansupus]